jgi:hypothetical protein
LLVSGGQHFGSTELSLMIRTTRFALAKPRQPEVGFSVGLPDPAVLGPRQANHRIAVFRPFRKSEVSQNTTIKSNIQE